MTNKNSSEGAIMDGTNNGQVEAISAEFVRLLKDELSDEDFREVLVRNLAYGPESCASHDFTDANMIMFDAFTNVVGREPSIYDGDAQHMVDLPLWNAAWDHAKENKLTLQNKGLKPGR